MLLASPHADRDSLRRAVHWSLAVFHASISFILCNNVKSLICLLSAALFNSGIAIFVYSPLEFTRFSRLFTRAPRTPAENMCKH
jgi:hypothetical protein